MDVDLFTPLLTVSLLAVLAAIPAVPYGKAWGYRPSGFVAAMGLIVMLLIVMGYIGS